MASILVKEDGEQHNNGFVPITPVKTLNCALNCEAFDLSSCFMPTVTTIQDEFGSDQSIRPNCEAFDLNLITSTLIGANMQLNRSVSSSIAMAATTTSTLFGEDSANQCSATPDVENEDDEVTLTNQRKKKQKVGSDLNRKAGEKRQNKYYWAKIDVPRPHTPTPKTPKVVTSKPPKSKIPKPSKPKTPKVATPQPRRKNDKRNPTARSTITEHVEEEPTKETTCKRSLNFEAATTTHLEWGYSLTKPGCNVSNEVVGSVFDKTTKDTTCTQALNPQDGDIAVIDVRPNIKINEKRLMVYHRRFNSKCLYKCRNLVPNFQEKFKKKRLQRNKRSFAALKRFEGFNYTCLVGNLLDRILSVQGKLRMLLPAKVDLSQDFFRCILSLLSSRVMFMKKKRLPRARRSRKQLVDEDEPIPSVTLLSSLTIEPLKDESNEKNISTGQQSFNSNVDLPEHEVKLQLQLCTEQCRVYGEQTQHESGAQLDTQTLFTSKGPAEGCRGSKTNVVKEKNSRRTYKRKGKQEDYLSKLNDWHDASVENIMDDFARQFGSLKLNDDPKTWLIVISDQDNKTDGVDEKIKMEERAHLFKKIGKFLQEMYYYQGSKEFIKWNGSVLDSVVGVFLTQNVSDILSSNAFMNLASKYPIKPPTNSHTGFDHKELEVMSSQGSSETVSSSQKVIVEHPDDDEETTPDPIEDETTIKDNGDEEYDAALREMLALLPDLEESKKKGKQAEGLDVIDWEKIRVRFFQKSQRTPESEDSVDWEAVRKANVLDIAQVIRHRGQHRIIAAKIQKTLNRLVEDHGSLDLEWLRNAPPQVAKAYLLSFYGLGLKSVECLRLLTLHHHGFPVDVNIGRIAIRLGWVPIKPLPPGMPFHLLQKYPLEDEIQKYLWPRLCHLKQETLYHLHYQMITFGKVFCQKRSPNCRACPFKADCKYYASLSESQRLALPGPIDRKTKKSKKHEKIPNPFDRIIKRPSSSLPCLTSSISSCSEICVSSLNVGSSSQLSTTLDNVSQAAEYFVEVPASPKPEVEEEGHIRNAEQVDLVDIEDCCDGYMYHLKLNTEEKKQISLNYCQESDTSRRNYESREMVSVSSNVAFNPLPKQVNVARLRTEHQVYELPKENQLLDHLKLEMQLGDVPYLLAIWTPGQVEKSCDNTEECPCSSEGECTSRQDSSTIPGTLLLPVQTALRRSFPLNGTYFQMNEVFVDEETSERPFNVPTDWIWNLKKRTLYCGSSTSTIVRGTTEMEIRQCFREGFVCTRGFNRETRAPVALSSRFHNRPKGKSQQDNEDEE